jgi:hypothetical protein
MSATGGRNLRLLATPPEGKAEPAYEGELYDSVAFVSVGRPIYFPATGRLSRALRNTQELVSWETAPVASEESSCPAWQRLSPSQKTEVQSRIRLLDPSRERAQTLPRGVIRVVDFETSSFDDVRRWLESITAPFASRVVLYKPGHRPDREVEEQLLELGADVLPYPPDYVSEAPAEERAFAIYRELFGPVEAQSVASEPEREVRASAMEPHDGSRSDDDQDELPLFS